MAKATKASAKAREQLEKCEKIARELGYEGYDAVIERLGSVEGVAKPKIEKTQSLQLSMTLAGVTGFSTLPGQPLLDNWAAAARRHLIATAPGA